MAEKRARRGFAIIENHVLEAIGRQCGANGIAVYAAIARYANHESRCGYPSYQALATITGLHRTTVIRMIARLQEAGVLAKRSRRAAEGDATSNEYELLDVPLPDTDDAQNKGGVVAQDYHGGSTALPGVVAPDYHGGSTVLPEQEVSNKRVMNKRGGGGGLPPPAATEGPPPPPRREPEPEPAWEAWEGIADVPAQVWRDRAFVRLLRGAGLGRRPPEWYDTQTDLWRAHRAARGIRPGYRVWQDLVLWYQGQERHERQKGASR